MSDDKDIAAIWSWERNDQGDDPGRARGNEKTLRYVCQDCGATFRKGEPALEHQDITSHIVRLEYLAGK